MEDVKNLGMAKQIKLSDIIRMYEESLKTGQEFDCWEYVILTSGSADENRDGGK